MTSRRSSGSSRTESAVEPTRSQNMTVSCRRSADDAAGAVAGDGGEPGANAAPQLAQNLACGGLRWPHDRQAGGSDTPQWMQNLLASGISALQLGQSMSHLVSRGDQRITEVIDAALGRGEAYRRRRQHRQGSGTGLGPWTVETFYIAPNLHGDE